MKLAATARPATCRAGACRSLAGSGARARVPGGERHVLDEQEAEHKSASATSATSSALQHHGRERDVNQVQEAEGIGRPTVK